MHDDMMQSREQPLCFFTLSRSIDTYMWSLAAGLNCAEAVNFGPPDWLPWGHYVGNKYRKDAKAATLSNDALLVNLAKAAPMVQKRLAQVWSS